jgi:hypothetical protein
MVHVAEYFFGIDQNLVTPPALDVSHKSHAARIVFERRIIQPLLRGQRRKSPRLAWLCGHTAPTSYKVGKLSLPYSLLPLFPPVQLMN